MSSSGHTSPRAATVFIVAARAIIGHLAGLKCASVDSRRRRWYVLTTHLLASLPGTNSIFRFSTGQARGWEGALMAFYKYGEFLTHNTNGAFDQICEPGHATPYSGIYRCEGCGNEAISTRSEERRVGKEGRAWWWREG